jgi:hypothetical protein
MPSRERVAAFVATVEDARYVEALEEFYHPDASMQDNQQPPREGRARLIADERATMASFALMRTDPVEDLLIDGDKVMIRWKARRWCWKSSRCSTGPGTESPSSDSFLTPARHGPRPLRHRPLRRTCGRHFAYCLVEPCFLQRTILSFSPPDVCARGPDLRNFQLGRTRVTILPWKKSR